MSYLVLARKYRPQRFEDIIGEEHVTRTLSNALRNNRLHHAFLFTGARGVGKTTAARILAKALSCVKAPTAEPCNECEACQEISSGASVDVQEIDAASNNGVDSIRELRESIRYAPLRGKKKVYILDEVHMLSSGAWNALLKTLEEPPPHAVFVFATTDPHKLPATILSRVQRYDFTLVPTPVLVDHLTTILTREGFAFDPAALTLVAREAAGSVRDALSLLDQVLVTLGATGQEDKAELTAARVAEILGVADRSLLARLAQAIIDKERGAVLLVVDELFRRGYDLAHFAETFLAYLRDLIVVRASSPDDARRLVDVSSSELDALRAQGEQLPSGLAELLFDRFLRVVDDVGRSLYPRYVLEIGLLELVHAEGLEPVSLLLERLEQIEARLGGSVQGTSGGSTAGPGAGATRGRVANPGGTRTSAPAANAVPASSAPQSPPLASSSAPASAGSGFSDWVQAVLARDATLSLLAQGRLLRHEGELLKLGFESAFAAEAMRERLAELSRHFAAVTGQTVRLEIEQVKAESMPFSTESLIDREMRENETERRNKLKEAVEHPVRQWIDDRFGGTWKEPVIPEGEG